MAHFTKVWPAGLTGGVTTASAANFAQLDTNASKAINGDDGGTWAPAAAIIIGGAGLRAAMESMPTFVTPPSRNVITSLANAVKLTNFSLTGQLWLQSSATGASFEANMSHVHDGATLSNVEITWKVLGPHVGVPATLPRLSIARLDLIAGTVGLTLNNTDVGTGLQIATPANAAAWDNGGATQTFLYPCNQNNVIDHSRYAYLAILTDESGANALSGNTYYGLQMQFTAIPDMRAP